MSWAPRDIAEVKPGDTRNIGEIQPGLFRIRLVRKGPWVAARIRNTAFEMGGGTSSIWFAEVDGKRSKTVSTDPFQVPEVDQIWNWGEVINQSEYDYLLARSEWARKHSPDHPAANPTKPIDLGAMPPVYKPKGTR